MPAVQRDTVAGDTAVIFATSVPFSPPRALKSSRILATGLAMIIVQALRQPPYRRRGMQQRGIVRLCLHANPSRPEHRVRTPIASSRRRPVFLYRHPRFSIERRDVPNERPAPIAAAGNVQLVARRELPKGYRAACCRTLPIPASSFFCPVWPTRINPAKGEKVDGGGELLQPSKGHLSAQDRRILHFNFMF